MKTGSVKAGPLNYLGMVITSEQLYSYARDGFLILEDFVEPKACDGLRERIAKLVNEFDPTRLFSIFTTREQNRIADDYFMGSSDKIRFFFEENAFNPDGTLKQEKSRSINKIGHALHDLDPVFNKFSRNEKIETLATDLGIQSPLLLQSMYIFKQPNMGGEVNCHQDSTFLYTEPIDIAGLWFALEDATRENGCLWAISGGHKRGLKSRWIRSSNGGMRFVTYHYAPWHAK